MGPEVSCSLLGQTLPASFVFHSAYPMQIIITLHSSMLDINIFTFR